MMKVNPRIVNWVLRRFFQTICRIDTEGFKKIPTTGPLIVVGNHINFLESPVVVSHIDNPRFTGMAKKESWDNPLFHFLFDTWGIIPIDRDNVDREAFNLSTQALNDGKILAVAPEGTRSMDGRLLPGKPGVMVLAMRSKAPLLPVGFYGYEHFWRNLKRLRRSEFHINVGEPFVIHTNGEGMSKEVRQAVTDEIMFKIAELLPEQNRGHYQFEGKVHYRYLRPI